MIKDLLRVTLGLVHERQFITTNGYRVIVQAPTVAGTFDGYRQYLKAQRSRKYRGYSIIDALGEDIS